jgi:hypothetical protein
MCEYDSYENDDGWCGANYEEEGVDELYDPSVDYRLCDCFYSEEDEAWQLCGICTLVQKKPEVSRTFPKEVAYIQTAIARYQGTQNAEHKEYLARALLRYFAKEATDLLATSLTCRDLVRAKCDELEESPLGPKLTAEITAAREAADDREINAFRFIL